MQRQVADVGAVQGHGPAGGVGERGDQLEQRGLARAGGADQGDGLARRELQADPAQDRRRGARIGERDLVEDQAAARSRRRGGEQGRRAGLRFARIPVRDGGLGVEDLVDPLRGGRGLLAAGDDVAHGLDRPDQQQGQRDERDQAAHGQLAPADGQRAEQQDQADHGVRDEIQAGPEGAAQPGLGHLGGEDLVGNNTN